MYRDGRGVDKYLSIAVEWYRKAAKQDHADAQNNLGLMYEYGDGVDKNEYLHYCIFHYIRRRN